MNDDDRKLLEQIQSGDGESFGVLYDRTRDWLLSFVIRPRVGASDADDVLSETFQTALSKVREFEWRGVGVVHWLAAIARRKCQEHVRAESREALREEPLHELFDLPDDAPTREAEMIRRQTLAAMARRIEETLSGMSPRYATALRLRLLEGRERADCARELGVCVGTFDVVLYRATQSFAKRWRGAEGR